MDDKTRNVQVTGEMDSDSEDRRSEARFGPEVGPTHLWISLDKRIRARVIDESESGLGVRIDGEEVVGSLEEGFQVRVQRQNQRRTASIVNVVADGDGIRIGIKWVD